MQLKSHILFAMVTTNQCYQKQNIVQNIGKILFKIILIIIALSRLKIITLYEGPE